MASQAYYIEVENKVLALNKAIGELQSVIDLEIKQNENGLLSPENYDVQGTLNVNLKWLAKRVEATIRLLDQHVNNAFYATK